MTAPKGGPRAEALVRGGADSPDEGGAEEISRGLVLLLAATTGLAVANLYYAQPLLQTLGRAFHASAGTTGLLVTAGQVGYVAGLAFVVPLGDLVERRRLVGGALALTGLCQALAAVAPNLAVFALATLLVGLTAVVAQVIVPLAAHLAAEHERGRVIGAVMSGLLIGVLLSRTLSGAVAGALGWRGVFWLASALMLVSAVVVWRRLPRMEPAADLPYRQALRSVLTLVRGEPVLRLRMLLGACGMGCFSVLWTALAFLLAGAHHSDYHFGNAVIGLFGLAGVGGAGAAQVAGRLADGGRGRLVTTTTLTLMLGSFALLLIGAHSLIVLILGIVVLDLGVQGTHISNQSAIYRLHAGARSRLTTAYMVAYFTGGIALSAVTGALYEADGWAAVCALGAATAAVALIAWALACASGSRAGGTRAPGSGSGGAPQAHHRDAVSHRRG